MKVSKIGDFKLQLLRKHSRQHDGKLTTILSEKTVMSGRSASDSFMVEQFLEDVIKYATSNGLTTVSDIARAVDLSSYNTLTMAIKRRSLSLRTAAKLADYADLSLDKYVIREFG